MPGTAATEGSMRERFPEPSDAQLAYLYTVLGYKGMPPRTAARASYLIDQLKMKDGATDKQIALLARLGWTDLPPMSKSEASEMIDRLLNE